MNERLISVYCLIGLYLPYDLSLNPFLPSIKQILKFEVKNLNDTNKILIWFTSNLVYNNEKAFNDVCVSCLIFIHTSVFTLYCFIIICK